VLTHQRATEGGAFLAYASLAPVAYLVPGVVLLARRNWHVVGWLLCLLGVEFGFAFSSAVGVSAMRAGDVWLVWLLDVTEGALLSFLYAALLVVFPDGLGTQTRRQARIGRAVLTVAATATALQLFVTKVGVTDTGASVVPSPLPFAFVSRPVSEDLLLFVTWVAVLVALVGLVLRYRASHAAVRRQYRWVLASLCFTVVALIVGLVGSGLGYEAAWFVTLTAYAAIPVAFMVAILRYRLYDIDRIVSRTVTYSVVVTMLAVAYLGATALLTLGLSADGDIAVAASTLLAAGLFRPLRQRVRRAVDRRFNRSRFDADNEIERFARGMRQQTDLAVVTSELRAVVHHTMQPESVRLWIRPS
jgi:uncharacterized membrane protein YidH (DUF202 family)